MRGVVAVDDLPDADAAPPDGSRSVRASAVGIACSSGLQGRERASGELGRRGALNGAANMLRSDRLLSLVRGSRFASSCEPLVLRTAPPRLPTTWRIRLPGRDVLGCASCVSGKCSLYRLGSGEPASAAGCVCTRLGSGSASHSPITGRCVALRAGSAVGDTLRCACDATGAGGDAEAAAGLLGAVCVGGCAGAVRTGAARTEAV